MDIDEQRKFGMRLAKKYNMQKTLAAIKNTNCGMADILNTAASEIGVPELVLHVLEIKEPSWAIDVLRLVPNLGAQRDVLIQRIEVDEDTTTKPDDTLLADEVLKPISQLELNLVSGAAFAANFTMNWLTPQPGTSPQPGGRTSNWIWSDCIAVNNSQTMNCTEFVIPGSNLSDGDTIWMLMHMYGYTQNLKPPYKFMYSSSGGKARIDTWGASKYPKYNLTITDG